MPVPYTHPSSLQQFRQRLSFNFYPLFRGMAVVAFDLDNTLAYMDVVAIWGDVFSVENLENTFNMRVNPSFRLSNAVRAKMKLTERRFVELLLERRDLLKTILRPNLDAFMRPLLQARRSGKVRAIIIYSNTWSTYSVRLAKDLLNGLYGDGAITCAVDAADPIRAADWKVQHHGQIVKTFRTLKRILRERCADAMRLTPADVLFVDEWEKKHQIADEERKGLVYLKPTFWECAVSRAEREEFLHLGLKAMSDTGLLYDTGYLMSDVFNCVKFGGRNTFVPIRGITDMLELVQTAMLHTSGRPRVPFRDDTVAVRRCIAAYLARF